MASKGQISVGDKFLIDVRTMTKKEARRAISLTLRSADIESAITRKKKRAINREKAIRDRLEEIMNKGLQKGMKIQYGNETLTIKNISDQGHITFKERKGTCSSPWPLEIIEFNSEGEGR